MAVRTRTIQRGDTEWTYRIFRATPKKWLCQTAMKSGDTEALWQTMKGAAATRRWWQEKTGQDFDPCPAGLEHIWRPYGDQGPKRLMVTICAKCGEQKTERR